MHFFLNTFESKHMKFPFFAWLLLGILSSAEASYFPKIEGKVSYFYPTSTLLRHIYQQGGVDYQIEASYKLVPSWDIFAGVDFFSKSGQSVGEKESTKIRITPIFVGVYYHLPPFCLGQFSSNVYGGLAGTVHLLRIDNEPKSTLIRTHLERTGVGARFIVGWRTLFSDCLSATIFGDYTLQKMSAYTAEAPIEGSHLELSGFRFGVGAGVNF